MPDAPRAIGIIMDGNRRWAKEQGLPTLEGHRAGLRKVEDLLAWSRARGIEEVTVYAFSTENWNRSEKEVSYLMTLFGHAMDTSFAAFRDQGGRVRFIGERRCLPGALQARMTKLEEASRDGVNGTFAIALSYGGRAELLAAVNGLLAEGRAPVTEDELRGAMWSSGLRDPDLIIRTGGDMRLSNFLPWQSVYSELFFTDTKWPDFSEAEFASILAAYGAREQRRGK